MSVPIHTQVQEITRDINAFDGVIKLNYIFMTCPTCTTLLEVRENIHGTLIISHDSQCQLCIKNDITDQMKLNDGHKHNSHEEPLMFITVYFF